MANRIEKRPKSVRALSLILAIVALAAAATGLAPAGAADAAFATFLASVRADALKQGVSAATFDRETAGLEPDWSLPDLLKPGQSPKSAAGQQAEFTVAPQDYVPRGQLTRLADEGRALAKKHAKTLAAIEQKIGVDGPIVLAIWGRETAYGKGKDRLDAIRVLATQAYAGRRKDLFRNELILALKLIEEGRSKRSDMKSSWAGAMGLTQFMPSEFYNAAVDMDGDGRIDLFHSVPDALGSAAKQLKNKGWIGRLPWGIEVKPGAKVDCANEGPPNAKPISEWIAMGVARADGRPFDKHLLETSAYLMSPGGTHGPQFLVTENFKVLRAYNTSDLYALFVGHLGDRIAGGGDFVTPWASIKQLEPSGILEIQSRLDKAGYSIEKLDGRIGSETRRKIGLYERKASLPVDCWPSAALLAAMRRNNAQ
ncbi:MAG: lytic murein transglycosylase [Proteobacteria bacterium]|nr:lytic murein transglycosylase [Pseudomonadota bacterium]